MQESTKQRIIYSAPIGILLTFISGFIGVHSKVAPPGGVTEGWGGLPIPYYFSGVWGNSITDTYRCFAGMHHPFSSCFPSIVITFLIILLDIIFWSALSYAGMRFYHMQASRKKRSG